MHVAELLDSLGFSEDVEVVVARLPDKFFCADSGETLFDYLDCGRELYILWLSDE